MKLPLALLSLVLLSQCVRHDLVEVRTVKWQTRTISYGKPRLWNKAHLTWRVDDASALAGRLSTEEMHREIDKSFQSWEGAGIFTFSQAREGQAADITITFAPPPGRVWDGQLGTMGHAAFPWTPHRGHIYLDPSEWWSTQSFAMLGDPITQWLPHEIGHVLGLQHSQGMDHTMCATGPYDLPDDRSYARLRHLYAPGTPVIAFSSLSTSASKAK
jgi:predicted Zn-dependent protease